MEDYSEKVAMLLYCSEWLERLSAEFYGLLSQRVSDSVVASLMRVVSAQSAAHADVMSTVLKLLKLEDFLRKEAVNCVELTKPVGETMLRLMEVVKDVSDIDALSYSEILNELKFFEMGAGEETYHRILLPLLRSILENSIRAGDADAELRLRLASDLLDDVVRQERLHEEIVMKSYEILARRS